MEGKKKATEEKSCDPLALVPVVQSPNAWGNQQQCLFSLIDVLKYKTKTPALRLLVLLGISGFKVLVLKNIQCRMVRNLNC